MQASTVSPVNVANKCQCGHDAAVHSGGTTATALCSGCGNFHQFTGEWETEPNYAFPQNGGKGYTNRGSTGKESMPTNTTTVGTLAVGATTITVANTAGAIVNGLAGIRGTANMEYYVIVQVLSATQFVITSPGMTFTAPTNAPVVFVAQNGCMQGPGRSNPYQRGG